MDFGDGSFALLGARGLNGKLAILFIKFLAFVAIQRDVQTDLLIDRDAIFGILRDCE